MIIFNLKYGNLIASAVRPGVLVAAAGERPDDFGFSAHP
jgi:hypothetical protein